MNRVTTTNKLCSPAKTGSRNPASVYRRLHLSYAVTTIAACTRTSAEMDGPSPELTPQPARTSARPAGLLEGNCRLPEARRDDRPALGKARGNAGPPSCPRQAGVGVHVSVRARRLDPQPQSTVCFRGHRCRGAGGSGRLSRGRGRRPVADHRESPRTSDPQAKPFHASLVRGGSPGSRHRRHLVAACEDRLLLGQSAGRSAISERDRFRHGTGRRALPGRQVRSVSL